MEHEGFAILPLSLHLKRMRSNWVSVGVFPPVLCNRAFPSVWTGRTFSPPPANQPANCVLPQPSFAPHTRPQQSPFSPRARPSDRHALIIESPGSSKGPHRTTANDRSEHARPFTHNFLLSRRPVHPVQDFPGFLLLLAVTQRNARNRAVGKMRGRD